MTSTAPTGQDPGTLSAAGLYTAPAATPAPFTTTVTATSSADASLTHSATLTVNPPANQPSLLWLNYLPNVIALPNFAVDAHGDLALITGAEPLVVQKLSGTDGGTLSSYTGTDLTDPFSIVSDGEHFFVGGALGSGPVLLGLNASLTSAFESTPCNGGNGMVLSMLWGGNPMGLLLGLYADAAAPIIVSASASTGSFPCSGGIAVRPETKAQVNAIMAASNGAVNAAGFYPGGSSSCPNAPAFLGQFSPAGTQTWMDTLPVEPASFTAVETTQNDQDVVYVAGQVADCQTTTYSLWVGAYNGLTGALLWNATWNDSPSLPNAGVWSMPFVLPRKQGGVGVVGSMTAAQATAAEQTDMFLAEFDATGKQTVGIHIPQGGILTSAALAPGGMSFYAAGFFDNTNIGFVSAWRLPAGN